MKKTKVVHLTSVHPRYDTRIFVKMCSSLANFDFDVNLVVADGKGTETINGVKIHDVGFSSKNRLVRMSKTVINVYKKAIELHGDIYHFHDPELMPVGLLLKKQGKKVFFDVHEDLPRQIMRKGWIPGLLRKPLAMLISKLEKFTAKKMDGIVTVTPTIAKRFTFTKVVEVRNYALLSEFSSTDIKKVDKYLYTYIGGISKDRGIVSMVDAFALTCNKLTLGGNFHGQELLSMVEKLPGWVNVDFLGWQSREQVSSILEKSLVGIVVLQPTGDYEDAFPVKLFEYMASGAAVIASDFPLWKDIIEEANCGLCVDPTSPSSIAKAINYLSENPQEAIKMGDRGRKAVLAKFNWDSELNKLLDLYVSPSL